jgi:CRP/FNR family transcriptional regulator, cyclic AMP receptor protein
MQKSSLHYPHCFELLSQSPLFSALEETALGDMLEIFQYQTRLKGETVISPQKASDHFYLIISGRAKVSVYNPDSGREHILFLIGAGDGFDVISLLDGEWHEAVATALDDMEVLTTSVKQARRWIEQHPQFNRAFLPYLGKQLHELASQASDLSLHDTEARLSRLVLRNLVGDQSVNEVQLINDLSQETLASMIGSVRVVITRHLQKWKQQKVISGKRGNWSILNLQALLDKAEK